MNQREDVAPRDEKQQQDRERRRQIRGLVVLAIVVILFAIFRFGVRNVFTPGWWRLW